MLSRKLARVRASIDRKVQGLGAFRRIPDKGWIASVRAALGMSQPQLAKQMKVARQTVSRMEARELAGTLSLNQLKVAADALGCDLVYALVPRKPLNVVVEERAKAWALTNLYMTARTMDLEDQGTDIHSHQIDDYVAEHVTEHDLWGWAEKS